MAVALPVVNYYVPTMFETEVVKYAGRDGNYVMDFRNVDKISDAILKNTADFVLGSIPMSRVNSVYEGDYLEIDNALKTASKKGTGNVGFPEFVGVVKDFLIIS